MEQSFHVFLGDDWPYIPFLLLVHCSDDNHIQVSEAIMWLSENAWRVCLERKQELLKAEQSYWLKMLNCVLFQNDCIVSIVKFFLLA